MGTLFHPQMLNGTWSGTCFLGCSQEFTGDFESDPNGNFKFAYSTCSGPAVAQGRIEASQDGQIFVKDISPGEINGELKIDTFSVKLGSNAFKVWTLIQSRAPPPPAPEHHDDLKEFLTDYDLSFLVDDSGSMQNMWGEVSSALQDIVETVFKIDGTGIDLGFVNSTRGTKGLGRGQKGTGGIKTSNEVMEIFRVVKPKGISDIGQRLEAIIGPFLDDMDNARKKIDREDEYAFENEKSFAVIVITDGKESGGATKKLQDVINSAEKRFKAASPIRKHFHVIFLQVGNEEITTLDELKNLPAEIVHVVKNEHRLTSKRIFEALLGRFEQASEPGSATPSSASLFTAALQQTLLKYHTVVLVDDSPSMVGAKDALSKIISAVVDKAVNGCGVDGIELRFIDNDASNVIGLKSGGEVDKHLASLQADASSEESIKDGLSSLLNSFVAKWTTPGDKTGIKPMNVIVFTDWKRDGKVFNTSLNAMIQKVAERLNHDQAPPSSVCVQFVVMGGEFSFQPVEKNYAKGVVMINTTEYKTPLTEQKLVKILLGAVDPAVSGWKV